MAGRRLQWMLIFVVPMMALPVATGLSLIDPIELHGPTDAGAPAARAPHLARASAADETDEARDGILFRCPDVAGGGEVVFNPPNTKVYYGCPIRVEDGGDLLGSMDIAVNPHNPADIAILSLHGAWDENGPTNRSRGRQPHTAFVSADGGVQWFDNPLTAPPGWLGEGASGAFDDEGNLYIGYQYGTETPDGKRRSVLSFYKGGSVAGGFRVSDSYTDPETFTAEDLGGWVDDVRMAHVPSFDPRERDRYAADPDAQNNTDNRSRWQDVADPVEPRLARIVAAWHTSIPEDENTTEPMRGWIDAAWTHTGRRNNWTRLPVEERIGPCLDASNVVGYHGRAYVACVVDRGYKGRPGARIGDVDVWRIDPFEGKTKFMGYTGVEGMDPLMAVTEDGYFALIAQMPVGFSGANVYTSFSWHGTHWTSGTLAGAVNLGPELHRLVGGRDAAFARVTALAITPTEKTVFLLYSEQRVDPGPIPTIPDPTNPRDDHARAVITFNECSNLPIAAAEFRLGTHVVTSDPSSQQGYWADPAQTPAEAFQDLHDGLVYFKHPTTDEELVYFAVNDHGIAQFGAMVASWSGETCSFHLPFLPSSAIPIPQALQVGTAATKTLAASAGIISTAMIGYLLTMRRKAGIAVAAEDRR